jgi:hypothetical protein
MYFQMYSYDVIEDKLPRKNSNPSNSSKLLIEKRHSENPDLPIRWRLIVCRAKAHDANLLPLFVLRVQAHAENVTHPRHLDRHQVKEKAKCTIDS